MGAYGQTESIDEIETHILENLKTSDLLYRKLKPFIIDLANLSNDAHVKYWHQGFGKGHTKRRKDTTFSECSCVNGSIRRIFMENNPKELDRGK